MEQTKGFSKPAAAGMLLAVGLILPFFTGQIPQVGKMLLPMHLPVLLCGLLCGPGYGAAVGLILPPLRFALFGMPPLFPTGAAMMAELAAYGLIAGWVYARAPRRGLGAVYAALLAALLGGRLVWGAAMAALCGTAGQAFTLRLFLAGAFGSALPGIVLQLTLLPAVMTALTRRERRGARP